MITCASCGTVADAGQRFCGQCGSPLTQVCSSCGSENPPGHRFCGQCGSTIGDGIEPRRAAPTTTERRVVSVLFVDLVGFAPYAEGRDPEEVRSLITEYFDMAGERIARFGGTVDKFIGDAVMAWWGATVSLEDDAERAVRAALDVVDAVAVLGDRVSVPGLSARAAVMTGEAAVGPGGNEQGLLLGDLVNSASRLQSVAEPGTVLVGDATASRIREAVELVPAGSHAVKGKAEPITAWQAVRVLAERGGRGKGEVVEPPFVGRLSELRLLKDLLHNTGKEGRARLLSLVGEAGIGKSRLVSELRKYADGLVKDVYWHEGRSPAYGDQVSLWALGEMIRRRAGLQETDDDTTTGARIDETIAAFFEAPEEASWVGERLKSLLGLAGSTGSDRHELFAAARALFEQISAQGTVVMAFEDLHWADPSLLEFVEELTDWSHNYPILVVTLARPDLLDRRPDWGSGRRGFASLRLGPLTDEEMTEMIEQMVAGIPSDVTRLIVDRAAGVPLFAVEMVRMLQADGRLVSGAGGIELRDTIEQMEVPDSIQAIISARLDRLDEEEREIVRDAAVLGQSFTLEGLAAIRDEPADKTERRLSDLVRREILEVVRDQRSPERGQYRWVQSVVKEVAYGRMSRADRHQRHLLAARYYRDLNDPELAPVAASNFVSALEYADRETPELREEFLAAVSSALQRARTIHAHDQVISLADLALPVVPDEAKPDLWEWAAEAADRNSDFDRAQRYVDDFLTYGRSVGGSTLHHAMALAGRITIEARRARDAVDLLEPYLAEYPDFGSDPHLARAAVQLSRALMLVGRDSEAARLADEALAAVESFDLVEEIADAMITRGTALSNSRPRQSIALLKGALALCRQHELTATGLRAQINIGYASGDIEESFEFTKAAFEEAKRVGDRSHALFVVHNLVGGLLWMFELDEAERILADPIPGATILDLAAYRRHEAALWVRRGDRDRAERLLDEAKALAAGESDMQALLHQERTAAYFDLLEGRSESAYEMGLRHFTEHPFAPWQSLWFALTGANLLGDHAKIAEVQRHIGELPGRGENVILLERMAAIGRDVTSGEQNEAVGAAYELVEWLDERRLRESQIQVLTATARNLPKNHPERAALADKARGIASAAGALGLVAFVDMAVG